MLGLSLTSKDLVSWILSHSVPKEKVDKQPTKVILELYIREAKHSRNHPASILWEEQPPPPLFSGQACGKELPVHHD